jgi:multiple sugar transport system permease protein
MTVQQSKRDQVISKVAGVGASLCRIVLILGISYIILLPVFVKISSSFMIEKDLYDQTVRWIPRHFTLDNYALVWEHMKYPRAFLNSLALSILVSVLQLISCTLAGYGFARYRYPGSSVVFGLVIFMLIVPPQTIMLPLYMNFRYFDLFGLLPDPGLNLLGSYWPLVLLSLTGSGLRNGLFIYIMRQHFQGVPDELEEAAYVDGAGHLTTFFRIMLPNAIPVLVVVFLFAFVWQWNDDFYVNVFMGNGNLLATRLAGLIFSIAPTPGEASHLTGQYISLVNNTGMLLFTMPLLVIYALMQRFFIESVERTGIVG